MDLESTMGTLVFSTHTLTASDGTSHKTHQLVHLCTRTRQCAYEHVHVCGCGCFYERLHTSTTCIYMNTCVRAHGYECECLCSWKCVCTSHFCEYTDTRVCMSMDVYACECAYKYVCVYVYAHTWQILPSAPSYRIPETGLSLKAVTLIWQWHLRLNETV